jgi:tetratricopeptide (TPR) repeat protein
MPNSKNNNQTDLLSQSPSEANDATAVGYKQPPANRRFKPGQSGNPRGRPKGRPNVANAMKAAMNQPVAVRMGGKTHRMATPTAILHSLAQQAAAGENSALFAILDIYDMTGRTTDITDEEHQKRALRLPKAYVGDESDLVETEAREKDRERYRMIAEGDRDLCASPDDSTQVVDIPANIKAGDLHATAGSIDEALVDYRAELDRCKAILTPDDKNEQAQHDFRRAVSRIGLLAETLLHKGQFERAITIASDAIAEGSTKFWVPKRRPFFNHVISNTTWIRAIRAHAHMLLGRVEEARKFYHQFKSNPRLFMTSWETAMLRDFVSLRRAGHSHPLMDEIEQRYAAEGWTTDMKNTKAAAPKLKDEDAVFVEMYPDDIKSGDLLLAINKVHEAANVYLRNLEKWKNALEQPGALSSWTDNLRMAVDRVTSTIERLFRVGKFITALECAERAASTAPEELRLQAIRALALVLFGGRDTEAQETFLRYRGKHIGDQSWEAFIAERFNEQRRDGCGRPLMDEIEQAFATGRITSSSTAAITDHHSDQVGTELANPIPNDEHVVAPSIVPNFEGLARSSDIGSGDLLMRHGKLDDALVVYQRRLQTCETAIAKFAQGQFNVQAIDDKAAVLEKLSDLAFAFLLRGEFARAFDVTGSASCPLPPILDIRRAHALLFLDRAGEAKGVYLLYRNKKVNRDQRAEEFVAADFASLREVGRAHPLMDEIEQLLNPKHTQRSLMR